MRKRGSTFHRRVRVIFLALCLSVIVLVGLTGGLEATGETSATDNHHVREVSAGTVKAIPISVADSPSPDTAHPQTARNNSWVHAVESNLSGVEEISFENPDTAKQYAEQEQAYLATRETVITQINTLQERATTLRESPPAPNDIVESSAPPTHRSNLETLDEKRREVTSTLFQSAMKTKDPEAIAALNAIQSRSQFAREDFDTARRSYERALARVVASHKASVQRFFLSVFGVAFIAGLLIGIIPPYRRYKNVRYDRQFTSVAYQWTVARVPLVLGFLILAVATGLTWVIGDPTALTVIL